MTLLHLPNIIANIVDCTANPTSLKKHFKHIIHIRYLRILGLCDRRNLQVEAKRAFTRG